MLIDWFTVAAQAINFLILVWLLKRYLYRPVLAAIDAREKTVARKIAEAATNATRAQGVAAELRKRQEAFDQERESLLRKATDEAAAERQRLMESARADSQLLRSGLTLALDAERTELGRQLSLRTQAEVFALARQALSDLAGVSLEERMIAVFIERLSRAQADVRPAAAALVRTAFAPAATGRTEIEAAIHERLGADIAVHFETSPDLVCGVELTVDGVKLPWSVADYLATLAQDVAALRDAAHVD